MRLRRHAVTPTIAVIFMLAAAGCATTDPVARPHAMAYTHPVPLNQVQDAAFWIHPTDSSKSLILLTNETRGLEVHNTDGYLLKLLPDATNPQYVDVIYGFNGCDYAIVSCDQGVKVVAMDPEKRKLKDVTADGFIKTFDDDRPLGLFCYRSPTTEKFFFFITDDTGRAQQYELSLVGDRVTATLRRSLALAGKSKGGCADNDAGVVYFSEDSRGIWQYPAEPDDQSAGQLVIKLNEHGLIPHARGPVIFRTANGGGYLLVTSQGAKGGYTCIKVYDRAAPHRFLATIDPSADGLGPLDHSSGLDVASAPFGKMFPHGVLAVNDQDTPSGNEDFKLYSWSEIAAAAHLSSHRRAFAENAQLAKRHDPTISRES